MKTQRTLSDYEFHELFPDEAAAVAWFETMRWADGRTCPHCQSERTTIVKSGKPQPYRCRDCRKHFSVKTGTVMHSSKVPVKKWLHAVYLISVSKKGLSALQLGRTIGIAPETAWKLGHKIRESWNQDALFPMNGSVEIDETYIGGKERNRHASERKKLGRGPVGKQAVMGFRERESGSVRAFPIARTDGATLRPMVRENVAARSQVYTDCHLGYRGMREYRHEAVAHSAGEYVNGMAHTNGIESFWALLKRGITGSYHHVSVKHLSRYVDEFCFRHNNRDLHALAFMAKTASLMVGRRLTGRALVDGDAI
ncbi:MAG: IS1595 family transposase [Gammaproteobacteria bacterium]|nr:IS1595 family transposase [Gammaproteobacteria bacterium]